MPDAKCQTKMKGTLNRQKSWLWSPCLGGCGLSTLPKVRVCKTQGSKEGGICLYMYALHNMSSHTGVRSTLYTLDQAPSFRPGMGLWRGMLASKLTQDSSQRHHTTRMPLLCPFIFPDYFHMAARNSKDAQKHETWRVYHQVNHPSRQPLDFYLARSRNVCPCRRFRKGSPRVGPSEGQDGSLGTCKKCWIVLQQTCTSKPENTQTHIAYPSKTCELQEISTASHHTSPIWLVYRNSEGATINRVV